MPTRYNVAQVLNAGAYCDTGQDGAYNINPMSFTDNNNGTVIDNNTGLVWQKCSVGQNNDATCSGTATAYNWYQATGTYDATYNFSTQNVCGALTLGGNVDWRLPSIRELISIVDYSIKAPGPTIQQTWFPNTAGFYCWLSTINLANTSYGWVISLGSGHVTGTIKDSNNKYNVRCVRGGV